MKLELNIGMKPWIVAELDALQAEKVSHRR